MIYHSGAVHVCGGFSHSVVLRIPTEMAFSQNGDYPVTLYAGQSYNFDVIMESALEGSFGGVISIETDIPEKQIIHVPVWGTVTP
ncbi:MAG: hypothetical protein JXB88_19950 [Spirochaetales bacterium]|nr:hypothetical protein [Spirochaetales bacterium]